jgi:dTDP-glucose 4,6-dehydratase
VDGTYNIGGNKEWANIDIVALVCKLMDLHRPKGAFHVQLIAHVKSRAGHDRRYAIDATKISTELRYLHHKTFEPGIRKTVEWYLSYELWWRGMMDRKYQGLIHQNYNY